MRLSEAIFQVNVKVDSYMPAVTRAMRTASLSRLSHYGGYVSKAAKRSIRKAPFLTKKKRGEERTDFRQKSSRPGDPPFGHRSNPIKRGIRYSVERQNLNVVIGPEKDRLGAVLRVLEYGGRARWKNLRRTRRKVGDGGELRLGGRPCGTTKIVETPMGNSYQVTYGLLRTQRQADEANRINEHLYGPEYSMWEDRDPRPFMRPAQARSDAALLPGLWQDSIR